MSFSVPVCQTVRVFTFRGERGQFAADFLRALADEKNGGATPSRLDCLRYAGHTGVSIDSGKTIYGFNPDGAGLPAWQLFDKLKRGERLHGVVLDDSNVFSSATKIGLTVLSFEVILPEPDFRNFEHQLREEFRKSRFWYGFPDGDGECNCTTWLERLALPLLMGRMDEFVNVLGVASKRRRRFGQCV